MPTCIFCRLDKSEFNDEHVIPASIGGGLIINTVCIECNTTLGKNIDSPFSKHNVILHYRNVYRIGRSGNQIRKIPNAFPGKHLDDEGNEIRVEYNEDGTVSSYLIPQYKIVSKTDDVLEMQVTLSQKDLDIEKFKQRISEKYQLHFESIIIDDIKEIPSVGAKIKTESENNDFILGTLKIAYEFACTQIPDFLNDPNSIVLRDILINVDIHKYENIFYGVDSLILRDFIKHFEELKLANHIHAILLTTVPGIGLCCGIRIFNWVYAINLSKREHYISNDVLLLNYSTTGTCSFHVGVKINSLPRISNFNIQFGFSHLPSSVQKRINEGYKLIDETKAVPVYCSDGVMLIEHITLLISNREVRNEIQMKFNTGVVSVECTPNKLYLKVLDGFLVPIWKVDFYFSYPK